MKIENKIIIGSIVMGAAAILFLPEDGKNNFNKLFGDFNNIIRVEQTTKTTKVISDKEKRVQEIINTTIITDVSKQLCFTDVKQYEAMYLDIYTYSTGCKTDIQVYGISGISKGNGFCRLYDTKYDNISHFACTRADYSRFKKQNANSYLNATHLKKSTVENMRSIADATK